MPRKRADESEALNCYYHVDREAVGTCVSCGRPICLECKVVLQDRFHCNTCANRMYAGTIVAAREPKPNWFVLHLNWSLVLSWATVIPVLYIGWFIVGFIEGFAGYEMATEGVVDYLISALIAACWLIPTNLWVLRKKGQRLWHLPWLIMPFGWIILLSLENRQELGLS